MKLSTPRIVLSVQPLPLTSSNIHLPAGSGNGYGARIAAFCREFFETVFTPYYPERHYMRGPGPACAKRARAAK